MKAASGFRQCQHVDMVEELLRNAVSNADFHYLGSSKIMSGIGKGFAEAMIQLQNKASKK